MNDYNIKKLYEEMEMHLIESMHRNLGKHLLEEDKTGFEYPQWQAIKLKELKRYQRENRDIIKGDTKGLSKYVSDHLHKELRQGSINAIKEYNKHHKNKLSPDKLMTKSFFKTNDRKVNALIKSINNDLKTANTSALRMTNDQYRQIIHKSAFFVGNGVFTEQQASKMAVKELTEKKITTLAVDEASKNFLAGGLNCIEYKDGRKVNIASYAEMAIRTASLRTHLMGEGDFRKSIGRTLVQVTTHGESCDGCSNWEGKILVDDIYSGGEPDGKHTLLSDAMAQGLFHPNCRHGLTTYYSELEGISYDTPETDIQEELQDKINYYTRQEKKYDRLSVGSLDSDNRKEYRQKELLYEKKKEELIKIDNKTIYENISNKNNELMTEKQKQHFKDVTVEFTKYANPKENNGIIDAKSITKDGHTYRVNSVNKIVTKNHEIENGNWFLDIMGGQLKHLPEIHTHQSVNMADFKYYPTKGSAYFIENKEIILESGQTKAGINNIFHKIEESKNQANVFIVDVTGGNLTDNEIMDRLDVAFRHPKTKDIEKTIIVKNGNELFGIFTDKKKSDPPDSSGTT